MAKVNFFKVAIIFHLLTFSYLIYCDIVIVNQDTVLRELNPTSDSAIACYKTDGRTPVYLSLERNNMLGYWPNFITLLMKLLLINPTTSQYLPREEKYSMHYHSSGQCSQNYKISDDNIQGVSEVIYDATIYLAYFEIQMARFSGRVTMNTGLREVSLPDYHGSVSIKANFEQRHSPALTKVSLLSQSLFNSLFQKYIGIGQRCIVILNLQKSYLMYLNTANDIRIPYFHQITALVINNGQYVYFARFYAYPSECPVASSAAPAQNVLVALNTPVASSEVRWQVVPREYVSGIEQSAAVRETTVVTFSNEQRISILDQNTPNGINFCSAYRPDVMFLLSTRSTNGYCNKIAGDAFKLTTDDQTASLETTYRTTQTSSGHIYDVWRALPVCSDC